MMKTKLEDVKDKNTNNETTGIRDYQFRQWGTQLREFLNLSSAKKRTNLINSIKLSERLKLYSCSNIF